VPRTANLSLCVQTRDNQGAGQAPVPHTGHEEDEGNEDIEIHNDVDLVLLPSMVGFTILTQASHIYHPRCLSSPSLSPARPPSLIPSLPPSLPPFSLPPSLTLSLNRSRSLSFSPSLPPVPPYLPPALSLTHSLTRARSLSLPPSLSLCLARARPLSCSLALSLSLSRSLSLARSLSLHNPGQAPAALDKELARGLELCLRVADAQDHEEWCACLSAAIREEHHAWHSS